MTTHSESETSGRSRFRQDFQYTFHLVLLELNQRLPSFRGDVDQRTEFGHDFELEIGGGIFLLQGAFELVCLDAKTVESRV